MSDLPVPLIKVLDLCEEVAQDEAALPRLQECLPKLRQFIDFEAGSFERFSWDILWSDRVKELLGSATVELDAHRLAVHDIEAAIESQDEFALEKASRDLKMSAVAVWEIWQELRAEDQRQELMSPYPVFDRLFKVSKNILDKNISEVPLRNYFSRAANLVLRLGAAVKRFKLFYKESPLTVQADKFVTNLEFGMGAVDEYLRNQNETALRDSLRLALPAAAGMFAVIKDMGQIAVNERKFAEHPLVEELCRARECGLSGHDLDMLWGAVRAALTLDVTRIQNLLSHPLASLAGINRELLIKGSIWVDDIVGRSVGKALTEVPLGELDKLLLQLEALINLEERKVNLEYRLVEGAKNFEEMIVSVGLAIDGAMSGEAFTVILDELYENIGKTVNDLNGAVGSMDVLAWERLYSLLELQLGGCNEMRLWINDGNVEHLRQGWHTISLTIPETRFRCREMRKNLLGKDNSGVTCMKCGTVNNGGGKFCSKCGAVLMQLAQAPTEYTEIGGGSSPSGPPASLSALESLIRQVECGDADAQVVKEVVDGLLSKAVESRNVFVRRMMPIAEKSGLNGNLLANYQEAIDSFIEGLNVCLEFISNQDTSLLYRGYEMCSNAVATVLDLQDQLPE